MESLIVYKSKYNMIRVGSDNTTKKMANNFIGDGGYVVADVSGYDILISAGIADDISFESAFLKLFREALKITLTKDNSMTI